MHMKCPPILLLGLSLTAALAPTLPAQAQFLTVGTGSYPGGGDNAFPFGSPTGYTPGAEYQELYPSSAFAGPTTISSIAFASSSRFSPTTDTYGVTISLANTASSASAPSASFDANKGANLSTVFSGTLTRSLTENNSFDLVFPTAPFVYDPAKGNLLLDVVFNSATTGGSADFLVNSGQPTTGRVFVSGQPSATGSVDTEGLYTKFGVNAAAPFAEYDDHGQFSANTTGLAGGYNSGDYIAAYFQPGDNITAVGSQLYAGTNTGYKVTVDTFSGFTFTNAFGSNAFAGFTTTSPIKDVMFQRIGNSGPIGGTIQYGQSVAAVPEPSSFALLILGIGGLALSTGCARRRHG